MYAELGTISHGTMNTAHVTMKVARFLWNHIVQYMRILSDEEWEDVGGYNLLRVIANSWAEIPKEARDNDAHEYWQTEDAKYLLNERLWNVMQEFAPPFCYFGAHPGDGCDYGFWPEQEFLRAPETFPGVKVVEAGDETVLGENESFGYVLSVTDHGNATLYDGKGNELWAVV